VYRPHILAINFATVLYCRCFSVIDGTKWLYVASNLFCAFHIHTHAHVCTFYIYIYIYIYIMDRDSSDSLRTGRPGDRIPVGGEIFRSLPGRPWGLPSLLYKEYRVFPEGKAAGAWH